MDGQMTPEECAMKLKSLAGQEAKITLTDGTELTGVLNGFTVFPSGGYISIKFSEDMIMGSGSVGYHDDGDTDE